MVFLIVLTDALKSAAQNKQFMLHENNEHFKKMAV